MVKFAYKSKYVSITNNNNNNRKYILQKYRKYFGLRYKNHPEFQRHLIFENCVNVNSLENKQQKMAGIIFLKRQYQECLKNKCRIYPFLPI